MLKLGQVRHFPGYQAGASLKGGPVEGEAPQGEDFPGYQAGASLKVNALNNLLCSCLAYFPGYQAGASLKENLN